MDGFGRASLTSLASPLSRRSAHSAFWIRLFHVDVYEPPDALISWEDDNEHMLDLRYLCKEQDEGLGVSLVSTDWRGLSLKSLHPGRSLSRDTVLS